MNTIDTTNDEKAMIFDVLSDIRSQNKKIRSMGVAHIAYKTPFILSFLNM
jgi:hypothetical protein